MYGIRIFQNVTLLNAASNLISLIEGNADANPKPIQGLPLAPAIAVDDFREALDPSLHKRVLSPGTCQAV